MIAAMGAGCKGPLKIGDRVIALLAGGSLVVLAAPRALATGSCMLVATDSAASGHHPHTLVPAHSHPRPSCRHHHPQGEAMQSIAQPTRATSCWRRIPSACKRPRVWPRRG